MSQQIEIAQTMKDDVLTDTMSSFIPRRTETLGTDLITFLV